MASEHIETAVLAQGDLGVLASRQAVIASADRDVGDQLALPVWTVGGHCIWGKPIAVAMELWFWQAITPESIGVLPGWLGGHCNGCKPMLLGMAPWFWQAVTAESVGVPPGWLDGHGTGSRPISVVMAL